MNKIFYGGEDIKAICIVSEFTGTDGSLKIDIDEAAAAFGVTNQEDTIFERLKDKPEDFFEAIKEQGLTEE